MVIQEGDKIVGSLFDNNDTNVLLIENMLLASINIDSMAILDSNRKFMFNIENISFSRFFFFCNRRHRHCRIVIFGV